MELGLRCDDPSEFLAKANTMHIGVPKEIKNHEYRVALTPNSVRELCAHGHNVLMQSGAGRACSDLGRWHGGQPCSADCRGYGRAGDRA